MCQSNLFARSGSARTDRRRGHGTVVGSQRSGGHVDGRDKDRGWDKRRAEEALFGMFVSNFTGKVITEYAQLRGTPFWEERGVTDGLNGQREIHLTPHPSSSLARPPHPENNGISTLWHTAWMLRNTYSKLLCTTQSSVYQMHTHSFVVCRQLFAQSYGTRPAHRLKRSLPSSKNLIRQLPLSFTLSPRMRPWLINATHRCFCFMLQ